MAGEVAALTDSSPLELPGPTVEVSAKAIFLGSGPRFARDAFGPLLAFYLGYKFAGLVVGVVVASAVAVGAWLYERRHERSGLLAWLSLLVVGIQAVVGLAADDAHAYLAPGVLVTLAWGLAFTVSAVLGRPLAGLFAAEMYPFPPEVRSSATFRRVFTRISVAWGVLFLVRSVFRLVTLTQASVDAFVVVNAATGFPLTMGMMSWSIWYGTRAFRRSEEWGWVFQPAEPAEPAPAAPTATS